VEEASVGARRQGSQEIAVGASSDAASEPGVGTGQKRRLVRPRTSPALEPMQALGVPLRDSLRLELRRSAVARPPLLLRQQPRALREGKPLRLQPAPGLEARVLLAGSRRSGLIRCPALAPARLEPEP
jgi:hypothetical protein